MHAHYLQHVPFEGLGIIEPWLTQAGYEIDGENLNYWYSWRNKKYPIETKVYENAGYYVIMFHPRDIRQTSHELKITIQKKSFKVIVILKGS